MHKISKANSNSNNNQTVAMGKKPMNKQLNEVKRDSPTNTLERNKASLTDVQVCSSTTKPHPLELYVYLLCHVVLLSQVRPVLHQFVCITHTF